MTIYAVWVITESGVPMFSFSLNKSLAIDSELVAAFISAMQSFVKDSFKEEISFVTLGKTTLHIREGDPHTYIVATTADMVFDSVNMLNEIEGFFHSFAPDAGAFDLPESIRVRVESSITEIINRHKITETQSSINQKTILKRTFPLAAFVDSTIKKVVLNKFGISGLELISLCDNKTSLSLIAKKTGITNEEALNIADWAIGEGLLIKIGQVPFIKPEIRPEKVISESIVSDPIHEYIRGTISLENAINRIVEEGIEKHGWSRISAWWNRRTIKKQLSKLKYRNMTGILKTNDIPNLSTFILNFEEGES